MCFSLGRAIICLDLLMEAFVGNFNAPYAIDTHFFCLVLFASSVIFDFNMVFFGSSNRSHFVCAYLTWLTAVYNERRMSSHK